MRTVIPRIQTPWGQHATPEAAAINAAAGDLSQADFKRYQQHWNDPVFHAAVESMCEQHLDIKKDDFWLLAGTQHGPYPDGPFDICDTMDKMLHYWRELHPAGSLPADKGAAREQRKMEREQARIQYSVAYAEYVEACRERNARHNAARARCTATIAAAREQLAQELADPAPMPPLKP